MNKLKNLKNKKVHCRKFLRIYQINHLNLTPNHTVCVANCFKYLFYLIFYVEMFSRNALKFQEFIIFDPIYVDTFTIFDMVHNKLKKSTPTSNINLLQLKLMYYCSVITGFNKRNIFQNILCNTINIATNGNNSLRFLW